MQLRGLDDGCTLGAVGVVGACTLLLPITGGAGAHSSGAALLLGGGNGGRRSSGGASLLLTHLLMAVRTEKVTGENTELVQCREEEARKEAERTAMAKEARARREMGKITAVVLLLNLLADAIQWPAETLLDAWHTSSSTRGEGESRTVPHYSHYMRKSRRRS